MLNRWTKVHFNIGFIHCLLLFVSLGNRSKIGRLYLMACLQERNRCGGGDGYFSGGKPYFFTECDSIILAIQCLAKFM
jgi:hypothetical protein